MRLSDSSQGPCTDILSDGSGLMIGKAVLKRLTDEGGQALVMSALCMTCLIGFVALATDVGVLLREKRLAQIAADAGAIAGAGEYNYGGALTAAQAATAQNGFTNGTGGATVTVNSPPSYRTPYLWFANGYVEVIVQQVQPALFRGFLGLGSITVAARAVANANGPTNGCIYTLGTSGADLSMTGNANIQVTTCGIIVNSSSGNAISMNGNVTLDAQSIGVVGGVSKTGNITLSPTPVTGVVPTSNPLAFLAAPTIPGTLFCQPQPGRKRYADADSGLLQRDNGQWKYKPDSIPRPLHHQWSSQSHGECVTDGNGRHS